MFITVPLLIVALAVIALVFVVWRKWPFLKKLEPDAHSVGESFVHDLAPEVIERARRVDWRAFWHQGLQGVEEALKVFRKAFHAVGQGFERLGSSVQSVKKSIPEPRPVEPMPDVEPPKIVVPAKDDQLEQERLLKEEEQRLILDIAQDPKNVNLYKALGKIYNKLGELKDAVESYETAAKLDPDDTDIKDRLVGLKERIDKEKEREVREKQEAEQK